MTNLTKEMLGEVLTLQQGTFKEIEKIREGLRKLATPRRTRENLQAGWNRALGNFGTFWNNHRAIVKGDGTSQPYLAEVEKLKVIMSDLNQWILDIHPGLINEWDQNAELTLVSPRKSPTPTLIIDPTAASTTTAPTDIIPTQHNSTLTSNTVASQQQNIEADEREQQRILQMQRDLRNEEERQQNLPVGQSSNAQVSSNQLKILQPGTSQMIDSLSDENQNNFEGIIMQRPPPTPFFEVNEPTFSINDDLTIESTRMKIIPKGFGGPPSAVNPRGFEVPPGWKEQEPRGADLLNKTFRPSDFFHSNGQRGEYFPDQQDEPRENYLQEAPRRAEPEWIQAIQAMNQLQMQQQQQLLASIVGNRETSTRHVRIPNIELPTFSGNYKDYKPFKDVFLHIIGRTPYSPIERMQALRAKLTDSALRTIAHLTISDGNYLKAWGMLDRMFSNEKIQIAVNIEAIVRNPKPDRRIPDSMLQFLQNFSSAWNNLDDMKVTAEQILAHLIVQCMDGETRGRMEEKRGGDPSMPSREFLTTFIETEFKVMLSMNGGSSKEHVKASSELEKQKPKRRPETLVHTATTGAGTSPSGAYSERSRKCFLCSEAHYVVDCPRFLGAEDRIALCKDYRLCIFCARHRWKLGSPCNKRSSLKCEKCGGGHISELCDKKADSTKTLLATHIFHSAAKSEFFQSSIIMPTAVAKMSGPRSSFPVRILVDSGSEVSYISEFTCQMLGAPKEKCHVIAKGLNGATTVITAKTKIFVETKDGETLEIPVYVVPHVTAGHLPSNKVDVSWRNDELLELADPHFHIPSYVGALFGNDVIGRLMVLEAPKKRDGLLLQKTVFGWIVSGRANNDVTTSVHTSTFMSMTSDSGGGEQESTETTSEARIQEQLWSERLERYWDMPIDTHEDNDHEEDYCERLFRERHYRTIDGRYVVPIPWREDAPALGPSFRAAVRSYVAQERRWLRDPEHKKAVDEFMEEYIALNHMTVVPETEHRVESGLVSYVPYLSVVRKEALTTKLRIVFNASAPTESGFSVNSTIHQGPKLQTHIPDLIDGLREHRFIFSADVTKMFRQILVTKEDQNRLRIIWRPNPQSPLREFRLNTITYGLDCSPWLSIRCMHQIADDNAPDEETKRTIKENFYVDDLISGSHSIQDAKDQIQKITKTLEAGKLPLVKWSSNDPRVLEDLDECKKITALKDLRTEPDPKIKLLGLTYHPVSDEFGFKMPSIEQIKYTKRGTLSLMASIFDPSNWLLPVVMMFRILIQGMWRNQLTWDEEIDPDSRKKLEKLTSNLFRLNSFRLTRWYGATQSSEMELVGLCDSSMDAFAAVIYSRIKVFYAGTTEVIVRLIRARGNVLPLKTARNLSTKQITIPKMELHAIFLLAELYTDVAKSIRAHISRFYAYSDSEIAIAWVRKVTDAIEDGNVRRKVVKIKKLISPADVHHVSSENNIADGPSRGLTPEKFMEGLDQWVNGPDWIRTHEDLPRTEFHGSHCLTTTATPIDEESEEIRKKMNADFTEDFSCLLHLLRVVAFCLRWKRYKKRGKKEGPFLASEIGAAKQAVIWCQQRRFFQKEIAKLEEGSAVPKRSWLSPLMPFIDSKGLLRVGGRLSKAVNITEFQRHPIVLPKCHFTDLIISFTHINYLHAGQGLTERFLRDFYWIPALKSRLRKIIRSCVVCIRWRSENHQQPMADLPTDRLNAAPSFSTIGIDLCGPYLVKASRSKFDSIVKVWVAVFVCFSTRAVHLEIVDSLSTDSFLESLTRMMSRRGIPHTIWSDCGTNFVGASRALMKAWEKILVESRDRTAVEEITWIFNAPLYPASGGLWERTVRSFKFFTKRCKSVASMVYPEFNTLLTKIESILNSRPLCPNSLDAGDAPAITPFQLTHLRSFKLSAMDVLQDNMPMTKRLIWAHDLLQSFWERFQLEVYASLTPRKKWRDEPIPINIDDVCLIQEPSLTPGQWKMGKVIKTYADDKGVVRRVDMKTAGRDVVHRAVNKLVPLVEKRVEPIIPRRSPRNQTPSMVTIVMCYLASQGTTLAMNIESLAPGLHVKSLGDVSIIAFDFDFTVTTPWNVTNDLLDIDRYTQGFKEYYDGFNATSDKDLKTFCEGEEKALNNEASGTKERILSEYSTHKIVKRIAPIVAFGIGVGLTAGATGGALIYQQVEMNRIRDEQEAMRERVRKISAYLTELDQVEYDSIDVKLTALLENQRRALVRQQIVEYVTNLRAIYQRLILRHENLVSHFRPLNKLTDAIKSFNVKALRYKLPNDPFEMNPARKTIKDGMATIEFTVPILEDEVFKELALISVPKVDDQVCYIFSNGDVVQRIFASKNNATMFEPSHSDLAAPRILKNVRRLPTDDCTLSVLSNSFPTLCSKSKVSIKENMVSIGENVAIIFGDEINAVQMTCGDEDTQITTSAFINYTNCSLRFRDEELSNSRASAVAQLEEGEFDLVTLPTDSLEPFTKNIHREEIRQSLIYENSHWDDFASYTNEIWFWPGVASITTLIVIGIAIAIVLCCKKKNAQRNEEAWKRWASQRYRTSMF